MMLPLGPLIDENEAHREHLCGSGSGRDVVLCLILEHSDHSVKSQAIAGTDDFAVDQSIEIDFSSKRVTQKNSNLCSQFYVLLIDEAEVRRDDVQAARAKLGGLKQRHGFDRPPAEILDHLQLHEVLVEQSHANRGDALDRKGQLLVWRYADAQPCILPAAQDVNWILRQIVVVESQGLLRVPQMEGRRGAARSEKALDVERHCCVLVQYRRPGPLWPLADVAEPQSSIQMQLQAPTT